MLKKFVCPDCKGLGKYEHPDLDFQIECTHPCHSPRSEMKVLLVKAITTILGGIEVMPSQRFKHNVNITGQICDYHKH